MILFSFIRVLILTFLRNILVIIFVNVSTKKKARKADL